MERKEELEKADGSHHRDIGTEKRKSMRGEGKDKEKEGQTGLEILSDLFL